MALEWYWIELGFNANDEAPVLTLASLRAARANRLAQLKAAGAGIADVARLNLADDEARRHATDK
jgi:hypothetical protein